MVSLVSELVANHELISSIFGCIEMPTMMIRFLMDYD